MALLEVGLQSDRVSPLALPSGPLTSAPAAFYFSLASPHALHQFPDTSIVVLGSLVSVIYSAAGKRDVERLVTHCV